MDWSYFIYFAAPALLCWIGGAWLAYRPSFSKGAVAWTVFGLVIFSAFIVGMWISLERPPLRTMGETRLWYSFFLPVAGVITYVRWRYKWILSFSTLLAFVFICVNLFKPEIHNKTLMPALQSPWFAPHVIVYMFSYAMLGAAALIAIYLLIRARKKGIDEGMMSLCDNLVYVGMAFLTIGMLFGALWAKEALLELGPEGDMGGCHLVGVLDLYPLSPSSSLALFGGVGAFGFLFSFATGVLDWRELSTLRTRI